MNRCLRFATLLVLSAATSAQAQSLTTSYAGGNSQNGNLFDVQASSAIVGRRLIVTGLGVHIADDATNIDIYIKRGGIGGVVPESLGISDFEFIGSADEVTSAGFGRETELPLDLAIAFSPGERIAFYITRGDSGSLEYTNGSSVGSVAASNDELTIYEGYGALRLDRFYANRIWNGSLYYELVADFAAIAVTPNQLATATAVEGLGYGNDLFDDLSSLSDDEIRDALEQLSGDAFASLKSQLIGRAGSLGQVNFNRLAQALDDIGSAAPLGYAPVTSLVQQTGATAIWGGFNGAWTRISSDGNAAGIEAHGGGLAAGADVWLGDWRVGLMMNAGVLNVNSGNATAEVTSVGLGGYAGAEWEQWRIKFSAGLTGHGVDAERSISGALSETLTSQSAAVTSFASSEVGYAIIQGDSVIEPFAGVGIALHDMAGFQETGGTAALTVRASSMMAGHGILGVRGTSKFATDAGTLVAASASLAWRYSVADAPRSEHSFAGSDAFSVEGVSNAQNALLLDAGVDFNLSDSFSFNLTGGAELAVGTQSYFAKASLTDRF